MAILDSTFQILVKKIAKSRSKMARLDLKEQVCFQNGKSGSKIAILNPSRGKKIKSMSKMASLVPKWQVWFQNGKSGCKMANGSKV